MSDRENDNGRHCQPAQERAFSAETSEKDVAHQQIEKWKTYEEAYCNEVDEYGN